MKRIVFALLWLALALPAHALTFVQMPDQALLEQAAVVLEGQVAGTVPLAPQPGDYTDYRVSVSRYLKGAGASEATVRVPGSLEPDDGALFVPGMPRFSAGDRLLLFLNPNGDGSYNLAQSALGVFRQVATTSGQRLAMRDLAGAYEMPGTGLGVLLPASDQMRNWEGFARWLQATAAGASLPPAYWNAALPGDEPTTANFTTLGTPSRWFQFDSNQNITFRAHSSGQSGLSGGGFSQVQTGITAWVNDAGSNIRYVYGGTTAATGGLCSADGVNAIIFTDANQGAGCDADGTFDCNTGGVIATGGFRTSGTGTFNGTVFRRITEGDIVVNAGAGCFLAENGGSNAAEVYAHELGHTLGLGHSCGDSEIGLGISDCTLNPTANDALMRAFPHADGRGADLRSDDEAGAAFLYDASSSGGASPPATSGNSSGGGGGGTTDSLLLALMLLAAGGFAGLRRHPRTRSMNPPV